ncbi:MAG: ImmA/IrrE family metallo-endopeptidase [Treponemataceae bacterium]|nr:ImmA/IrrE family metallo-endopeptidase [Treponemataceae bacterium]
MANVELDGAITGKLKNAFNVSDEDIQKIVSFFNKTLKPALKAHYLSHLVTTIEEMINESQKKDFLEHIKRTGNSKDNIATLTKLVNEKRVRMFSIILAPIESSKRKARAYKKQGGVMIYYANYLQENEKRFAIAHELGHIVNDYILKIEDNNRECRASLFAYIALLDKNNFYKNEASDYISKTDIELFDEYINTLHIN